jgi:hypothetical protein
MGLQMPIDGFGLCSLLCHPFRLESEDWNVPLDTEASSLSW